MLIDRNFRQTGITHYLPLRRSNHLPIRNLKPPNNATYEEISMPRMASVTGNKYIMDMTPLRKMLQALTRNDNGCNTNLCKWRGALA